MDAKSGMDHLHFFAFVLQLSTEGDISTQRDSKFDKAQNSTKQLFVAVSTN